MDLANGYLRVGDIRSAQHRGCEEGWPHVDEEKRKGEDTNNVLLESSLGCIIPPPKLGCLAYLANNVQYYITKSAIEKADFCVVTHLYLLHERKRSNLAKLFIHGMVCMCMCIRLRCSRCASQSL